MTPEVNGRAKANTPRDEIVLVRNVIESILAANILLPGSLTCVNAFDTPSTFTATGDIECEYVMGGSGARVKLIIEVTARLLEDAAQ